MKMKKWTPVFLAIVGAIFASNVVTASAQPVVGGIETSADPGTPESIAAAKAAKRLKVAEAPTDVVHILTPVILPPKGDPAWNSAVDALLADAVAGHLGSNATSTMPGYRLISNGHVEWYNLVYSTGASIYNGALNPTGAWSESLGQVVGLLVESFVISGEDTLSLDMLSFDSVSNDGNILGTNGYDFDGSFYSPRAFAIKMDGTRITTGLTSEKGTRTFVVIMPKLFNVGGTQGGLNSVRDWVQTYHPYEDRFTVRSTGNETTVLVTTGTIPVSPVPRLAITRNTNGVVRISVMNGVAGRNYLLLSGPSVGSTSAPPMTVEQVLSGNTPVTIQTTGETRYYRAKLQ